MKKGITWIDRTFYPNFTNNWDDDLFRFEILKRIKINNRILDLGAGAGIVDAMHFRGLVTKVCGIDLDKRVLNNPHLDEAHISPAESIPYPDATFDLVLANNVMEHIENPERVLREIFRVLKPHGYLCFKTPNKWHYMPTIARLTPLRFHQFINKIRGRDTDDTFPTYYRLNSTGTIRKMALRTGFHIESLQLIEGRPEYLRMSNLTYLLGLLYERIVNGHSFFNFLRILTIACLQKTG